MSIEKVEKILLSNEKEEFPKKEKKITKIEIEKKKCDLFLKNLYDEFRSYSISTQFVFFYFFLLFIFVIVLIYIKINEIEKILTKQTNLFMYTYTNYDFLEKQESLIVDLGAIDSQYTQNNLIQNLLVMKIYFKELINRNFLLISNKNPEDYISINNTKLNPLLFSDFSDNLCNYTLFTNLSTLGNYSYNPNDTDHIGLNLLATPLFLITPLLSQLVGKNEFEIINFYLIAYPLDDQNNCIVSSENLFFKYPYEKDEISIIDENNTDIYDYFIDPVGKCFMNKTVIEKENFIMSYNWFYKWEEYFINSTQDSDFNFMTLLRQNDDLSNDKYFLLSTFFTNTIIGKKYNIDLTIKSKIILNNSNKLSEKNRVSKITLLNQYNRSNSFRVKFNYLENNLLRPYFIDDNSILIFYIDDSIDDIFKYGTEIQSKSILDPNSKYITMDLIQNNNITNQNLFFQKDLLFFTFANFVNTYYNNFRINEISNQTINLPRCSINNLTEYYLSYNLKQRNSLTFFKTGDIYDCLQDVCHYINCSNDSDLNNFTTVFDSESRYPNCLCMPMFCYNNNSIIPDEFLRFKSKTFQLNHLCEMRIERNLLMNETNFSEPFLRYLVRTVVHPLYLNEMSSSITILMNDLISETDSIINVRGVIYKIKQGIYIFYSITLLIIGIFFFYLSMVKFKVLNKRIDDSLKIIEESILYKETNEKENELLSDDQSKLINDQNDDQNEENIKEENKVEISKNYRIDESKIDDTISQEEIFENNYDDELDEIKTLIKNNRNEFKINMNSNSNIFMEDKTIIQFQVEVKKIKYLLNFNTENDKSLNNYLLKEIEDKYNNRILTTVQIMSELLSTELIFFDKINQNFSYSGKGKPSVNRKRILELIETNLYDEQIRINKILVDNIIQSFIYYFTDEINEKWAEKIEKI